MPRTEFFVSGMTSSSPMRPAKPRLMPRTSHPRLIAESAAARMTALRPGASPPPVEIAMRICDVMMLGYVGCDVPRANASRRRIGPDQVLEVLPSAGGAYQSDNLARLGMATKLGLLEQRGAVFRHFE